jgi:uncharacterized membrane protein
LTKEGKLTTKGANTERLGAFSDGVIAIIITIMVLEMKVPRDASMAALLGMWPSFFSYALSYLFIGIVWVNHHHLLRYTENADTLVIWSNLGFLFFVSLIPFFTIYMTANRMNSFATAVYAANFLLVTIAFYFFQLAIAKQLREGSKSKTVIEGATWKNWIGMLFYALAIPSAYLHPYISPALIFGVALLYFVLETGKQRG